jgi:tRNA (guanine37-N1)-methyltransferase
LVEAAASYGVTGRARERALWTLGTTNPRDFATDRHKSVDDRPYGGGPGMVMLAEPLKQAIDAARGRLSSRGVSRPRVIYMSPQGEPLRHRRVVELAAEPGLVVITGRYEGVDESCSSAPSICSRSAISSPRRRAGAVADRCDRAADCPAC